MKRLNLNSVIKVKLTDYGKDIFYHQYDQLNQYITALKGHTIEPRYPNVDENGFTRFQLWDFFKIYNDYLVLGNNKMPIEPLDIFIGDLDLEAADE